MESIGKVRVQRNGITHDLLPSQVTVDSLQQLFLAEALEVWLRDIMDDSMHFPVDGHFCDLSPYITLRVEGPGISPSPSP